MEIESLRLPMQAVPVNRWEMGWDFSGKNPALLPPFVVTVPVNIPEAIAMLRSSGSREQLARRVLEIKIIPEVSPIHPTHAYFSSAVNQLGVCSVLSGYAVARCLRSGGLF